MKKKYKKNLKEKMSSSFSLEDRNKFVGRMDRMFTENLQMRKDMNKIIMRSQNIVRAVKLEKKVCAPQIPNPEPATKPNIFYGIVQRVVAESG